MDDAHRLERKIRKSLREWRSERNNRLCAHDLRRLLLKHYWLLLSERQAEEFLAGKTLKHIRGDRWEGFTNTLGELSWFCGIICMIAITIAAVAMSASGPPEDPAEARLRDWGKMRERRDAAIHRMNKAAARNEIESALIWNEEASRAQEEMIRLQ